MLQRNHFGSFRMLSMWFKCVLFKSAGEIKLFVPLSSTKDNNVVVGSQVWLHFYGWKRSSI